MDVQYTVVRADSRSVYAKSVTIQKKKKKKKKNF